jgi:hypothetical protein
MKPFVRLTLVVVAALVATAAIAQSPVRVRGTIVAIDANVMAVKSRDGRDLKLVVPDNVAVSVAKAVKFEDIKQGDYVGTTTTPGPDGSAVAVEVHYLPSTVPEGQTPWDLMPGSTMTNGNVGSTVVATGKRELMLQYKGATQKVIVPDGVPLVRSVPGARSDLVPGEYIFAVAQVAADGTMSAPRVQVSKDGVKPPL